MLEKIDQVLSLPFGSFYLLLLQNVKDMLKFLHMLGVISMVFFDEFPSEMI